MFSKARHYIKTAFGFVVLGIPAGLYLYGAGIFGWFIPTTLVSAHTHNAAFILVSNPTTSGGLGLWGTARPVGSGR